MTHLKGLGNTKVNQLHIAVVIDHDVRRLHVTKDDRIGLVIVQKGEHIAQFDGPGQDLFFSQEPLGFSNNSFQVFPVNIFNDKIRAVVFRKIVVNSRDGWVVQVTGTWAAACPCAVASCCRWRE